MTNINNIIYILVGLPGCGKSTFTRALAALGDTVVVSADHWFERSGTYVFDPSQLGAAHEASQRAARVAMAQGQVVMVDNTNLSAWERQPYVDMAAEFGYHVHYKVWTPNVDEVDGRNIHGVPRAALERMALRFESPV